MEWRKPFSINTCRKYDASSLFGTTITEKRIRARTSVFCSLEVFGFAFWNWPLTNLKRNLLRNERFAPPHFSVAQVKKSAGVFAILKTRMRKVSYIHTWAHWAGGLSSFSGWVCLRVVWVLGLVLLEWLLLAKFEWRIASLWNTELLEDWELVLRDFLIQRLY